MVLWNYGSPMSQHWLLTLAFAMNFKLFSWTHKLHLMYVLLPPIIIPATQLHKLEFHLLVGDYNASCSLCDLFCIECLFFLPA